MEESDGRTASLMVLSHRPYAAEMARATKQQRRTHRDGEARLEIEIPMKTQQESSRARMPLD